MFKNKSVEMYFSEGMRNDDPTNGINRTLYRMVSSLRRSLRWMKVVVWRIKKKKKKKILR